jgi:hypothetical protein
LQVLGHYAESWRLNEWGEHPLYSDYVAGLCASRPDIMQNDDLWVKPRPLLGLDGLTMHWSAPTLEQGIEWVLAKLKAPAVGATP